MYIYLYTISLSLLSNLVMSCDKRKTESSKNKMNSFVHYKVYCKVSIANITKTEVSKTRLLYVWWCAREGASTSNSKSFFCGFSGQVNLLIRGGSLTRSSSSGNRSSLPKIELPVAAKFC